MKGKSVQNICIIFLFMLGVTVTQAGATVITVNNNGGGNYSSIQEAVNNAHNGDTILVSPGIYKENVKVNKELAIFSHSTISGEQTERTYIVGAVPDVDVFSISSSNVTINGFHIAGGSSGEGRHEVGLYLEGVQNCSLSNNTLVLNDIGIYLNNSQGNLLDNNKIGLGSSGIVLSNSNENVLSNNLVVANNQGISLNNSVNNTLVNNTAGSNAEGIFLGMSQKNKLAYNIISKNGYGIRGQAAGSNFLINNSLYLNDIGVYLNGSSNNTLYENEFINFLNAVDEGNNVWSSSSAGNFWNDYNGTDADGNGIGDTPYVINETTGSMDYMPMVNGTFSGSNSEDEIANVNTSIDPLNKEYPLDSGNVPEKGVVVEINELRQINTSLEEGPVFLRIGAEWCGACQSMKPILNELAAEHGGEATIMSADVNKDTQLAIYFGVERIPDSSVIVGIENGKYVYMQENGNLTTDRLQARIVGLKDKGVFERVLNFAILHEKKGKS